MEKENKVNFMTRTEWAELWTYILGTIGFVYVLTIAYKEAYVQGELAALVLIGVFGYLIVRHIHRADESREYRNECIQIAEEEGWPISNIKIFSWRKMMILIKLEDKTRIIIDEITSLENDLFLTDLELSDCNTVFPKEFLLQHKSELLEAIRLRKEFLERVGA